MPSSDIQSRCCPGAAKRKRTGVMRLSESNAHGPAGAQLTGADSNDTSAAERAPLRRRSPHRGKAPARSMRALSLCPLPPQHANTRAHLTTRSGLLGRTRALSRRLDCSGTFCSAVQPVAARRAHAETRLRCLTDRRGRVVDTHARQSMREHIRR